MLDALYVGGVALPFRDYQFRRGGAVRQKDHVEEAGAEEFHGDGARLGGRIAVQSAHVPGAALAPGDDDRVAKIAVDQAGFVPGAGQSGEQLHRLLGNRTLAVDEGAQPRFENHAHPQLMTPGHG